MSNYPQSYMLSSGKGFDEDELVSFDNALISAKISGYNLVRVSSILPIGCEEKKNVECIEGSIVYTAYGSVSTYTEGERIASAVAVGIPKDNNKHGIIMEFSGQCDASTAERKVIKMVEKAMKNHSIECKEILTSAIDAIGSIGGCVTIVSALTMW
ncbi:MAG: arginine decarboxylase, pyruvoyl-dependent [Methanobrevibacter sp.]|nr:arginine decarboxylase, pyruvoyl-dependent [Methanobrevibacter sp.]